MWMRPSCVASMGVGDFQELARALLRIGERSVSGELHASLSFRARKRYLFGASAIRRPRDTPIWKLEATLKCRSCRKGRYAPPVHMIKLTETREITPYQWVHPDEER
jgi:hypothetical protein